jgi:hypothetical protein
LNRDERNKRDKKDIVAGGEEIGNEEHADVGDLPMPVHPYFQASIE